MCLITEQKEAEILKEDLRVYKRFTIALKFDNHELILPWSTYFRDKIEYKVGQLHKQQMRVDNIFESAHDNKASEFYVIMGWRNLTHVHDGFHSALTLERLGKNEWKDFADYCCIIPKGSEVFRDKTGLIVSNQIILKEKID